jgi:hypothetical protein
MAPFTLLEPGFEPAFHYWPAEIFNHRYDFNIPGSRKNSYKSNNLPEFRGLMRNGLLLGRVESYETFE